MKKLSTSDRDWLCYVSYFSLFFCVACFAQVLEHKTPSERLIRRYERLVEQGILLSPEGWARACKMFERCSSYPAGGEIDVISRAGGIGENRIDGDRADVGTKWGDYYGTIDSRLQFKAGQYGTVMMGTSYSLVFVHGSVSDRNANKAGEWKIEGAPQRRVAGIVAAIRYLEEIRLKSKDSTIQKNATKSIRALKHLSLRCGVPNPC